MEIQQAVTFLDQFFQYGDNLCFIVPFIIFRELTVHILVYFPAVKDNRLKVCSGYNNQVPLGQANVRIMVCGKESARLVALDSTDQQKCFAGNFSINPVDM